MKLLFKRLSVYWLCFFISYMPYRQAHAILPVAAVVLDVVAGTVASVVAGELITRGVCGAKPWAANDPVFLCNAKTPKGTWLNKVKTSAKWAALLGALGYVFAADSFRKATSGNCYRNYSSYYGSASDCYNTMMGKIEEEFANNSQYTRVVINSVHNTYEKQIGWSYTTYRKNSDSPTGESANPTTYFTYPVSNSTTFTDEQFFEDFWQTSPQIPGETWLPDDFSEALPPVHPDPEWFPNAVPVTQPIYPAVPTDPEVAPYPKELPATHPDKRPASDPKPEYVPEDWPGDLPGAWPSDWPLPGTVPGPSPGAYPEEWPLPGSTPVFDPATNPGTGEPGTGTDPTPDPGFPVPLPVIGPMTRTEFEQVQAQNAQDALTGLQAPDFDTPQQQITDAMNSFLADKVDTAVPELGWSPFGYFSFGGGGCIAFNFDLSIGGKSFHAVFDAHCKPFEEYVRPTLEWSLYLTTGLYIYMLFTRTVRSM
ncbi:hypothetical protein QNE22_001700 [Vibrio fluvialis]|nr:hypothetical protein [Vibrio fluvialis]